MGERFGYDAENHQKEFFAEGNSSSDPDATYFYDGDGRRVKKVSATETTVFVYDASSRLIAEYSTAMAETQQVSYLTTDHLGSPRVITNESGAVTSRKDFTAFGEESATAQRTPTIGYSGVAEIRQGYTGYEKDDESGLDFAQARYYNSTHGRYTSVDPLTASASIKNPQTFNRYSYVLNSPYKFTDPLGLIPETTGACGTRCPGSASLLPGGDGAYGAFTGRNPFSQNAVEPEPPPRPATPDEQRAINKLNQLIADETTQITTPFILGSPIPGGIPLYYSVSELGQALTAARNEIVSTIAGLKPGEKNVGLQTAVNAINAIGDQSYHNDNPKQAPGGPYPDNKCNVFVGMAISTAGGAYPMTNEGKFPAANHLGDHRDVQKLKSLPVVTDGSLRIGDIVAYRHRNASVANLGHSAIYIGGGAVVYAGGRGGGVPKAETLSALDTGMSWTNRLGRTVRRYSGR